MMFAISLIGPLNLREYSTKLEMLPIEIDPPKNSSAPKKLTSESERLLTKLTEGSHHAAVIIGAVVRVHGLVVLFIELLNGVFFLLGYTRAAFSAR
ncbi:hypothetical protein [Hominenteromicrobium sp.]|uniref:hypothetical protein n=1 Tax=Hominenteromicrobium sp. TaxID=3073581 RepID=UPI00399A0BD6